MKLSRKSIIAIIAGVVLLLAVVGVAFAFISNNGLGQNASATPTRQFGFGRTGAFNGTPGAGGRFRNGTPTDTPSITDTPTSTPTPPITATFTPTSTFTPSPTVQKPFSLYYLSSPVQIDSNGATASAQVLTTPGKTCILTFTNTDGKILSVAGTGTTQADTVGICLWSWLIPAGTKPGTATVAITVDQYTLSFPMVVK